VTRPVDPNPATRWTGAPKAPEPAAAPFCTRCDGYGVVLPVGSSIAATCPACNGNTASRPERGPKAEPAAAPQVDLEDARRLADDGLEPFDLRRCIRRLADELDAHRAMRAELVALVADLRNEATAAPKAATRVAMWKYHDRLTCILGEQS